MLEIGPGLGVLTRYLAERVAHRARRRARPLARAAPRRSRGPDERRAALGRRARARPRRARAAADEARREPAVQRRDADRRREPRGPAAPRALVRDGAARGRRPLLRRARRRRPTAPCPCSSSSPRERTGFHPVSRTVFRPPPNVDSALVAFRRRPAAGRLRPDQDASSRPRSRTGARRCRTRSRSPGSPSREQAAAALAAIGRAAETPRRGARAAGVRRARRSPVSDGCP